MKYKHLIFPAYLTAALLVIFPIGDALLSVLPFRPGLAGWRFGATGVITSALLSPLLGLLIAAGVAAVSNHGRVLRFVSVLCLIATAGLLAASLSFFLDAVQVRAQLDPSGTMGFTVASLQGGAKQLLMTVLAFSLGVGGFRTAARLSKRKERATTPPLGS